MPCAPRARSSRFGRCICLLLALGDARRYPQRCSVSLAAAHAKKFYEQAAAERRVYTFLDAGSFLVFPVRGTEVVPFWSSESRMQRVQKLHVKYRSFMIDQIPLTDFISKTLPQLEAESISIGLNWSGERLTGYDINVADLLRNLDYWVSKDSG